jgi:hypothetical protein
VKSFARASFWRAYHGLDSIVRKDARQALNFLSLIPNILLCASRSYLEQKIFGLLGFQQNIAQLVAGMVKKSIGFGLGRTMILIICLDRCEALGIVWHSKLRNESPW